MRPIILILLLCSVEAWGLSQSSIIIHRTTRNGHQSTHCRSNLFRAGWHTATHNVGDQAVCSKLQLRPATSREDVTRKSISELFNKCLRSLGRGILFDIPVKAAVTDTLFGIQGKRRNNPKSPTSVPTLAFTMREGLTAIAIYLFLGFCGYSLIMENWSFVDALYFSVATFTTVGYGDLYPHTRASKLFTCAFSVGGIAFLAAALASIGSNLVEAELKAVRTAQRVSQKQIMRVFDFLPHMSRRTRRTGPQSHGNSSTPTSAIITSVVPFNATSTLTGEALMPRPGPKTTSAIVKTALLKLIPPFTFLVCGGVALGRLEGWSIFDSIYYATITAGTVGFGDLCPQTQKARLWSILFIRGRRRSLGNPCVSTFGAANQFYLPQYCIVC